MRIDSLILVSVAKGRITWIRVMLESCLNVVRDAVYVLRYRTAVPSCIRLISGDHNVSVVRSSRVPDLLVV